MKRIDTAIRDRVSKIKNETDRRIACGAEPDRALMAATFLYCMNPTDRRFPDFKKELFKAIADGELPNPRMKGE